MPARPRETPQWPVEDRMALASIIEHDRVMLLASIRRRMSEELRSWMDVEDVLQESSLRALASLDGVRLSTLQAFRGWFLAIAAHRIQEAARERRRRTCHDLEEGVAADVRSETGGSSPASSDRFTRIAAELQQLRPSQRLSLLLRDHHGLGWDAIAFMIGQPTRPSTRQLHFRARRSLASLLRRRA